MPISAAFKQWSQKIPSIPRGGSRQFVSGGMFVYTVVARIMVASALVAAFSVGSAAWADDRPVVRVGLASAGWAGYVHLDAAERLGYFEEAGIRVEATGYRGGAAALQAMVAGEADVVNYFAPSVAVAVSRGIDAVIVGGQMARPSGMYLITTTDTGIRTVSDLQNRRVGTARAGGTGDIMTRRALMQHGVTAETVPVGSGPSGLVALFRGDVDALSVFATSLAGMHPDEESKIVRLADYADLQPNALPALWVSNSAYIAQHSDRIEALLLASYRGAAYLKANRDFAIELLRQSTGVDNETVLANLYDHEVLPQATSAAIDNGKLTEAIETAGMVGLLQDVTIDEIYSDRFIHVSAE